MSTTTHLTDKLDIGLACKSAIYQAILDKGGTFSSSTNLDDYPAAIRSIPQTVEEDWIIRAKTGKLTDLSKYSLGKAPGNVYACQYMFFELSTITKAPQLDPSLTSIGNSSLQFAFRGCRSLITPPDLSNITTIGINGLQSAFYNCTSLTSVDLSNVTSIGNSCLYSAFYNCTSLTSIDLSSLTSMGNSCLASAFDRCTSLTSVDLSSLTSIGNYALQYAFNGCTSLTSVDLSSLTSVGEYGLQNAFNGCTSMTSVDLSSVTSIGNYGLQYAFNGCTSLNEIWVGWSTWPTTINALVGWVSNVASSGTFHCPPGLAEEFGNNRIPTSWAVVHDVV